MTSRRPKSSPRKHSASRQPARRVWLAWLGAVLAATFVVYLPSLDNDFTNWDDTFYVTENPLLAHPNVHAVITTPVAGNYHPLTIWSLALNHRISGLDPVSYHWLSLLLHLANTGLVFLFIRQLSQGRFWTTVVTSLLFGIHPMHVESVAWIAERKDVLYAFFYLGGLIAYLRHVDRRQRRWLGVALIAFVLSLASKPAAVVFPIALLAIDYFRRRPFGLPTLLEKLPFLVIALIGGLVTLAAQRGAGAIATTWSPFHKLLFASYDTVMYMAKLFVPVGLSAIYPYPSPARGPGPEFYLAFAVAAVLVPAAVYLTRRNRVLQFGLAFYFIHIVLVLQFFTVGGAVMADRYTYVSYIGLFFALAWWLDERPSRPGLAARHVVAGIVIVQMPLFALQTWKRCDVWQNSETLWNDTIAKYPGQIVDAYIHRGHYYFAHEKRYDAALADFNRALALNATTERIWFNKGNVLAALAEYDSALVCFERAVALDPTRADAVANRGAARLQVGDLAGAVADLSRSIALNPKDRDGYRNRSLAYVRLGEYEHTIADSRRAIELDPGSLDNHTQFNSIGFALQQLARHEEAIRAFDEAIRRAPSNEAMLGIYYQNRSLSWRALGERGRALADAREALRRGVKIPAGYMEDLQR